MVLQMMYVSMEVLEVSVLCKMQKTRFQGPTLQLRKIKRRTPVKSHWYELSRNSSSRSRSKHSAVAANSNNLRDGLDVILPNV